MCSFKVALLEVSSEGVSLAFTRAKPSALLSLWSFMSESKNSRESFIISRPTRALTSKILVFKSSFCSQGGIPSLLVAHSVSKLCWYD